MSQWWIDPGPVELDRDHRKLIAPMVSDMSYDFPSLGILADVIDEVCPMLAGRLRVRPTCCDLLNTLAWGDWRAEGMLSAAKGKVRRYASLIHQSRVRGYSAPEASSAERGLGLVSEAEMNGFPHDLDGRPVLPAVDEIWWRCEQYRHVSILVMAGLAGLSVPPDVYAGLHVVHGEILHGLRRMEQS